MANVIPEGRNNIFFFDVSWFNIDKAAEKVTGPPRLRVMKSGRIDAVAS